MGKTNTKGINKDKATLIASEYCTNGYNKYNALISAGYSESYAKSGRGMRIYDDIQVKNAISRIQASNKAETTYTIEQYRQELQQAIDLAKKLNQPSAMVSAVVAKGRSCGYDKDHQLGNDDRPEPLTEQELDQLKEQAKALTKPRLATG